MRALTEDEKGRSDSTFHGALLRSLTNRLLYLYTKRRRMRGDAASPRRNSSSATFTSGRGRGRDTCCDSKLQE
ncbi:hypothetical protein E2C01_095761 [Portunus trituberculatus]|uniref:Uncharacterized protein n=1 Tax=Portunus trituberculatus TaxID=210409 RepID=A0A5B7K526_PORTR|nr:hypothetical protein [Portunus trituberculatus]